MEVTAVREVTPEQFELTCRFNEQDFAGAFAVSPPDSQLFFELFHTPAWEALSDADKIERAAELARLASQARSLGVIKEPPIDKTRLEPPTL